MQVMQNISLHNTRRKHLESQRDNDYIYVRTKEDLEAIVNGLPQSLTSLKIDGTESIDEQISALLTANYNRKAEEDFSGKPIADKFYEYVRENNDYNDESDDESEPDE